MVVGEQAFHHKIQPKMFEAIKAVSHSQKANFRSDLIKDLAAKDLICKLLEKDVVTIDIAQEENGVQRIY